MKVFAPSAFRWPANSGQDYPYGLQDIGNDTLARALLSAGVVVADDPGDQVNAGDKPLSPLSATQVAAVQGLVSPDGLAVGGTASAASNTAKLNAAFAALDASGGGIVTIVVPGTTWINGTLFIGDFTTFELKAGCTLKMVAGTNLNMLRNTRFGATDGSDWIPVTSVTTADGVTCTVTTTNPHGLITGYQVLINGAVPDDFNDVQPIVVTGASTFTYRRDKNTGGVFTASATFINGGAFTGTSSNGSKFVTAVSSVATLSCGMNVVGANIPFGARIDTIDSATQFTLTLAATGANAGLTATFPLQCRRANRGISVIGAGTFDQNMTNMTTPDSLDTYCINFRNVGDTKFRDFTLNDTGVTALQQEGVYRSTVDSLTIIGGTNYQSNGVHVDHCGRDVIVRNIAGSTKDDFISYIQKQYIQYYDAGCPMGRMSGFVIEDIRPRGCLSAVKLLAVAGMGFDNVLLHRISGRETRTTFLNVPCFDPINTGAHTTGTARSIGTITGLQIRNCQSFDNPVAVFLSATAIALNATVSGCRVTGLTTGSFLSIPITGNLTGLSLIETYIESLGSQLLSQVVGSLTELFITDLRVKSAGGVFLKYESGSPNPINFATNVRLDGCASFCAANGTFMTWYITNAKFSNYTSAWFLSSGGGAQFLAYMKNCGDIPAGNFYTGTWGTTRAYWVDEGTDNLSIGTNTSVDVARRGPRKTLTVTQNTNISAPTGYYVGYNMDGQELSIAMTMSGGVFTITWDAVFVFPTAFVQAAANTTATVIRFRFARGKYVADNFANSWN